jgi:hypothetical protein
VRRVFDQQHLVAATLQPPCERGTGDAGAVDEDAQGWGLAAIDGCRMRSSPVRACMRLAARGLPAAVIAQARWSGREDSLGRVERRRKRGKRCLPVERAGDPAAAPAVRLRRRLLDFPE